MEKRCHYERRVSIASAKHSDRARLIRSQGILEYSLLVQKVEEQGWGQAKEYMKNPACTEQFPFICIT